MKVSENTTAVANPEVESGNTRTIKFNHNGVLRNLSEDEFYERFKVKYAPSLIIERSPGLNPIHFERVCDYRNQFRADMEVCFAPGEPAEKNWELKEWMFGSQVLQGYINDVYIGKVDDQVGYGVFAGEAIGPGKMVGEYTGIARRHDYSTSSVGEKLQANPYLFTYRRGRGVIDAKETGNETRFINHSAEYANAQAIYLLVDGDEHIIIVSTKQIEKGEQILFNYGTGYWRNNPVQFQELGIRK